MGRDRQGAEHPGELTLTGSCLCGAVAYAVDTAPRPILHCHCRICRKAHGAAFSSVVSVPRDAFLLRLGCLDTPVAHIWRSDAAAWYDPKDMVPETAAGYAPKS